VFDNSADGVIANALAAKKYTGITVAYSGDLDKSLRLLDEVCAEYPVKISDLLIAGSDKLAEHAIKYEHIRLANSILVTSGTAPAAKFATVKSISDFASAEEAAVWLAGQTEDYYGVLEGLKMYAIGDSYFGGSGLGQHQTWVNLLGYKYDMTYHNYGIGGNTVAKANGQSGNQPPMYTRYTQMPTDGDIYFVEGGRNDRHYNVPFGNNTDTNGNSFKGALNVIIKGIQSKNPNAFIVLVTPWSYKGESGYLGTNNDYADAMKELVEYYNDPHIVCLYAADVDFTGINMADARCRMQYCLTASDVSHLNANGMYMVAPKFDKWLAEEYAKFKGLTVTNSADEELFLATDDPVVDELPPEETTAAAPLPETTVANNETEPAASSGCGSAFAPIALLIALVPAALVIFKKKD
jgi:hypothetical protein